MRILIVSFFVLILLITPAFGKYLTSNDFSINVKGLKDYYTQNEKVSLKITIIPKNDDIAKEMSNRKYTFYNNLNTPRKTTVQIHFKNGPTYSQSTTDKVLAIGKDYTNWDEGIDYVEVNLSGITPSIESGVETFTTFEFYIENSEPIKVNITIVNPPKIESEISNLKSNLSEIEKDINELAKKIAVGDLKEKLNKAKQDLNDLEVLYRNKHYEDVCKEIGSVKEEINSLRLNVKKTYAKYYVDTAEDLFNRIDVNITKAESLIDLLKASGKNVLNYTLALADFKAEKNNIEDKVNDLKNSYNNGNYDDVISKGEDILKEENTLLEKLSSMISDLKSLVSSVPTTQTTSQTATTTTNATFVSMPKINVNWKAVGLYGGITVGAVVVVALAVIGIRRYLKRRRWDELK